jgi:hypothetical protein
MFFLKKKHYSFSLILDSPTQNTPTTSLPVTKSLRRYSTRHEHQWGGPAGPRANCFFFYNFVPTTLIPSPSCGGG